MILKWAKSEEKLFFRGGQCGKKMDRAPAFFLAAAAHDEWKDWEINFQKIERIFRSLNKSERSFYMRQADSIIKSASQSKYLNS